MKFLNYNSPLITFINKLVDHVLLGLLWVLASLPVVTFGAAETAMLYTTKKSLHQGEGKIFSTFWRVFSREFRQATVLWLIQLLLLGILGANCYILFRYEVPKVLYFLLLPMILFSFCWMQLWFGYLSSFGDTTKALLSNTFRMTVGSFPWALLLAVMAAAAIAGCLICFLFMPPVLLLIPGIYGMLAEQLLRKAFKKYLPEEPEELPSAQESEASC